MIVIKVLSDNDCPSLPISLLPFKLLPTTLSFRLAIPFLVIPSIVNLLNIA